MASVSRPTFLNGEWNYSEPQVESLPPADERILLMAWPKPDGWVDSVRIGTPSEVTKDWFKTKVLQVLGYNYSGWILDPNTKPSVWERLDKNEIR